MNNDLKKILFVEYCADLKGGGAQRVFLNILNALNKKTFKVYAAFPNIAYSDIAREIPDHIIKYNYDSKSPPMNANRAYAYFKFAVNIPFILFRWFYLIKKNKIEVVYVHSIISGLHFSLLKKLLGYKLIYHEHNMASQRPSGFLWRVLFDYVIASADLIIAISSDVKNSLIEFGASNEKVKVIFNGIDLYDICSFDEMYNNGMQRLNLEDSQNLSIVGMVGHFRPWKGQNIFVEALAEIVKDYSNVRFIIVGGVHDNDYYVDTLRYIEENKLTDNIIITGHQDKVEELIACMDIVVVPSVPEPFGLVVLEAMMMKKPVIAFNIGGPSEIIQHEKTGLLVTKTDHVELGNSIMSLVNNKKKSKEMGEAGRILMEKEYTSIVQARNIESEIMNL